MHLAGDSFPVLVTAPGLTLLLPACPAEVPVPANLQEEMEKRRQELVEHVAEVGGGGMHCRFLVHSCNSIAALLAMHR